MPRFLFLKLLTIKLIVCGDTRPARMNYDTYHEHTRNENVEFTDIGSRVTSLNNEHDNVIVCWDDIFYECKTDRHELCVENDINEDTVTANFDLTLFEPSMPSKGSTLPETRQVSTHCINSGLPTYTSDQSNLYTEQNSQTAFYQKSSIATSSPFAQKLHSRIHQSGNNDHAHMHAATNHSSLDGRADIEEIYKTESRHLTNKHNPDANLAEYASSNLDIISLQQDKSYLAPEAHVMARTSQEQQVSTKQTDIAFIAARKRCGMDMQQTSSSNKRIKSCESQNGKGHDDCHSSISRKSDPSKCALKSTLMNHIEFRNNLYIQKLNNELIPIKDITEAKNVQMSESIDRRIIFSRKFSENELLSFDIIKVYYFLYVLSSIKYEANRAIINTIIEIYAGKMNMRPFFHNIHTFDTVIFKSLETYPNKPIDIKEHHQYSRIHVKQCHMNINSAKNYAEKNVLFIKFVKETILDQTDTGHYVLKPHMWKLQMYMPEIGPYFNWRFSILEPLTYDGIPFYFDFDTEMEIIRKLLEENFGNESLDKKNSASSINRGVAYRYRKFIFVVLQSDQYIKSVEYRIYKFAFDLRKNTQKINKETIKQNLVFILAFSLQDSGMGISSRWNMNVINETFSLERLDSFFNKYMPCINQDFNMITHTIFLHVSSNIRKNNAAQKKVCDEMRFIIHFRIGVWILSCSKGNNRLHILRLTRIPMLEYFHMCIYGYK